MNEGYYLSMVHVLQCCRDGEESAVTDVVWNIKQPGSQSRATGVCPLTQNFEFFALAGKRNRERGRRGGEHYGMRGTLS